MLPSSSGKPWEEQFGLWRAVLVTAVVLFGPFAVAWELQETMRASPWLSIALGCALSVVVCQLGGLWWERRREAPDVLFSDLLVWGWFRRRAMKRRLADAVGLFASGASGELKRNPPVEVPIGMLRQLAADLEAADPYTHGHSRRVARYASLIARRLGLSPEEVRTIRRAAALHDIGKLHTPEQILDKPGRLTDSEFAIIKLHPGDGADMIAGLIDDPDLIAIVRHHHERMDGNGYPARLAGDQIPLGARIIAVADTFDAITTKRSYRQSRPHKAALDIMRSEAGTQLDPDAVRAFRSAYYGRRWLWVPAGAINAGTRLLAFGTTRLAGTGAIAAGTLALGGAAIVPATPSRLLGIARIAQVDPGANPRLSARDLSSLTASSPTPAARAGATDAAPRSARGPVPQRGREPGRSPTSGRGPASGEGAKPARPAAPGHRNSGSVGSPDHHAPTAALSAAGASASLTVSSTEGSPAPSDVDVTVSTPGSPSASAGAMVSTRSTAVRVGASGTAAGMTVAVPPAVGVPLAAG
jgi:putative nucleotidyltransferase with HDIG domain